MPSNDLAYLDVILVGDSGAGKTSLSARFSDPQLVWSHIQPGTYGSIGNTVNLFPDAAESTAGVPQHTKMDVRDTVGSGGFDRTRPLAYPTADVFVLCFAVNDRAAMARVRNRWMPEIRHHAHSTVVVLVGTKSDLRMDLKDEAACCTREEAEQLMHDVGAQAYVETSAKTGENVPEAFRQALKEVFKSRHGVERKTYKRPLCMVF